MEPANAISDTASKTQTMNAVVRKFRVLAGDAAVARLASSGFWALVIKVAGAGLTYVMLVAFARMLGAEAYGLFGMMLNLSVVFAAVVSLGTPTAIMRFWPSHMERREFDLAKGYYIGAFKIMAVASLVFVASLFVVSSTGVLPSTLTQRQVLLVAFMALAMGVGDFLASALRAQNRVLWSMVPRDIAWRVIAPAVAGLILWQQGTLDIDTAFAYTALIMAVLVLLQIAVSWREVQHQTRHAKVAMSWTNWRKPTMSFAFAALLYATIQQLDVVVVGYLLGAKDAGAYFAAQKTASLLGLAMIAGGLVAAPMLSAAFHGGRHTELQRICKVLAFAIAAATLAGFALLLVIGKPLLGVFNPAYTEAYLILIILAAGYAIDALAGPTAYLMQMTSLENTYLRIMAIVYAFVLALQLAIVPLYGAVAAAMATAFGVCVWNLLAIYHMRKTLGIDSSVLSFLIPPKPPKTSV